MFRAENSNTYRHLCEFTGLDIEMTIKEHYDEVLDMLDNTFQYIFEGLTKHCDKVSCCNGFAVIQRVFFICRLCVIQQFSVPLQCINIYLFPLFFSLSIFVKEIQLIRQQHDARPFKWLKRAPRIHFADGIQMLRDVGAEGIPEDISEFDLTTELEKKLGHIISEKYETDFYMLTRYPLKIRPFYTMPSADDPVSVFTELLY